MKSESKLTNAELSLVIGVLRTQVTWAEGGCLIKDDGSIDYRAVKLAESAILTLKEMKTN